MESHPQQPGQERNRQAGWHWQYNIVLDWYYPRIGNGAYLVLCALERMQDGNGQCFPGIKHLVEKLGKSDRTIFRALKTLEQYRLIRITRRKTKNGDLTSNLYTLLEPEFHPDDSMFPAIKVEHEEIEIAEGAPEEVRHEAREEAAAKAAEIAPEGLAQRVCRAAVPVPATAAREAEADTPTGPLALTPAPEALPVTPEFAAFCAARGIADPVAWTGRFLAAQRRTGARRADWPEFRTRWTENELARASRPQRPAALLPQRGQRPQRREETPPLTAPMKSTPGNTSAEDMLREIKAYQRSRQGQAPAEGKV